MGLIPLLPGQTPAPVPTDFASPDPTPVAGMVSGLALAVPVFVIGSIFILMVVFLVMMYVFGRPMIVAKDAATQGCIIQHVNTPKSASMKLAKVSGGGFQYKDVRDGTVGATPESVNNLAGRQVVLTFAQLGVSIPPRILGGISILVHNGVNSLQELKAKYVKTKIAEREAEDADGNPVTETVQWSETDDQTIVKGYDFDNFDKLLEQSKEERLIPLTIEKVPDFVEANSNADLNEKELTILKDIETGNFFDGSTLQMMGIAAAIALVILVSTAVK